jgi:hypothetical protein
MIAVIADISPRRVLSSASPNGVTPLFTRHMRGAIEAERDARRPSRRDGHSTFRYRSSGGGDEDAARLAAVNGNARLVTQASADADRWIDDGGSYDAEAVALRRVIATRTRRHAVRAGS